jgi:hypothetical protein
MSKFLDAQNSRRLKHDLIENIFRQIINKVIELVILKPHNQGGKAICCLTKIFQWLSPYKQTKLDN